MDPFMKTGLGLHGPLEKFWANNRQNGTTHVHMTHWPRKVHQMAALRQLFRTAPCRDHTNAASDGPLTARKVWGTADVWEQPAKTRHEMRHGRMMCMANIQDEALTAETWLAEDGSQHMDPKTHAQRGGLSGPRRVMSANSCQSGIAHIYDHDGSLRWPIGHGINKNDSRMPQMNHLLRELCACIAGTTQPRRSMHAAWPRANNIGTVCVALRASTSRGSTCDANNTQVPTTICMVNTWSVNCLCLNMTNG